MLATTWGWSYRRSLGQGAAAFRALCAPTWRDVALLAGLLAAAVWYQWPIFANPAGFIDSDSALRGIIARHIADGLVAPAFFYGLLLFGTSSSHLLALVGDPSPGSVVLTSRLGFAAFLTLHFGLLRLGFGRIVAAAGTLYLAVPPTFLLAHLTFTEFTELFLWSALAMLAVAGRVSERLTGNGWYALAGVAVGAAFWGHPQAIMIGAALVVTILTLRGLHHGIAAAPWLVGGSLIGLLPAIVGWGNELPTFLGWLLGPASDGGGVAALGGRLEDTARQALPVLFTGYWDPVEIGRAGGVALGLGIAGLIGWGLAAGSLRRAGVSGETAPSPEVTVRVILGTVALLALVGFVGSRFGALVYPPRRLLLLYLAIPGLAAAAIARAGRSLPRPAGTAVTIAAMASWLAIGVGTKGVWTQRQLERGDRLSQIVAALDGANVRYCEAPYWTAYWLSFVTEERIVCAQYEHERDPYYRSVVDRHARRPYRAYVSYLPDGGQAWIGAVREGFVEDGIAHRRLTTPDFEALLPQR